MEIISNCSQEMIKVAARALKAGYLVAFPTETVYGLGADATNEKAVNRIFEVKARPSNHPIIVHISSMSQLDNWAIEIPDFARKLGKSFWPGPLTLILKRSQLAKSFITGNQDSVGLRVPGEPIALDLLSEFEKLGGKGIAAPSANRFCGVSPTTSSAVVEELGLYMGPNDLILNGNQCSIGIESTIIDCTGDVPILLRPGAVSIQNNQNMNSINETPFQSKKLINAPGLLNRHYSPRAKVVLNATAEPGDGFLAMSNIPTPVGTLRLAAPNTIQEYSRILYASLRCADYKELKRLIAIPPEGQGLAMAIRDRLNRAAYGN